MPVPTKKKSLLEIAQEDKDFKGAKSPMKSDISVDELVKEFSVTPVEKKSADGIVVGVKDLSQPANVQEPLSGNLGGNNIVAAKTETLNEKIAYLKQAKIKESLKNPVVPGDNTAIDLGLNINDKPILEAERIRSEKEDLDRQKYLKSLDTGMGEVKSAFNASVQGLSNSVAGLPKSLAILSKKLDWFNEYTDKKPEDLASYKLGNWIEDSAKELFPTNPMFQDSFVSNTLPQAAGNMSGFALGGLTAGALKMSSAAAVATLGATQTAAQEYETALAENGGDQEQAFDVFLLNLPIGAAEGLPWAKFLKRLDNTTGGAVKNYLARKTINGLKGGTEEMVQEIASGALTNTVASNTYDKTREIFDGAIEQGAAGFILGALMNGLGSEIKKKKEQENLSEQEIENLDKAEAFVEEKKKEIQLAEPDEVIVKNKNVENKTENEQEAKPKGETTENIPKQQIPVSEENVATEEPVINNTIEQVTETQETETIQPEPTINTDVEQELTPQEETVASEQEVVPEKEFNDFVDNNTVSEERLNDIADKVAKSQPLSVNENAIFVGKTGEVNKIIANKEDVTLTIDESLKSNFENVSEFVIPEGSKRAGQKEYTAEKSGYKLSVKPDKEGYSVFLGKPGKDTGNVDSFNEIKSWFPENDQKLNTVINEAGKIVEKQIEFDKKIESGEIKSPEDVRKFFSSSDQPNVETETKGISVPPSAPIEQVSEAESPELKKRKFTQQVKNDPDISDEFKQGITEDTENYVPTSNNINNKEADLFIESNGADSALDKLSDTNNNMKPKARVSVANKLIKHYNKSAKEASTEADKKRYLDKAIKTTDFIAKHLTELGQGVQAASMYAKLSPEGVLRYVQREINKTRKTKLDRVSPKLKGNKQVVDQINKDAVKKVLSDPKIKKIIEGKISNVSESRKKAVKKATDFLEGLKINTKGVAGDATFIIPATAWNGAIATIQKSLELGLTVVESIDAAVKYIKANHKDEWDEQGFRKKFSADLSKYEAAIDPAGATKKGLKDLDIAIKEIVEQHYTKVDSAKKTLVQKILDNSDLTEVDAKEIAKNIEAEFDKLTTDAKKKALIKSLSLKSILPNSKERQLYDNIIKLSNIGALSEADWHKLYAEKMGLPELTTQQAEKLMNLADKVQNAKEGEQKTKATQDLLAYQEKIKGVSWADVGSSIWYANILSGLSTQTTNAFSGFMEILGELSVSMVKNPKNTGVLLSNLFQGWGRGGLLGLDVLKTGYQPDKGTKIDVPATLENIKFKGGKWNPFNYSKYVSRLMTAVDIFHYHGLKQMRSAELAMSMAAKEGKSKPSQSIKNKAIEILNNSKERISEAKQQAKDEGLTGQEYKRRVYEIIEQSRPEQVNEDANDFAAHGTFNYEPEGVAGLIASAINFASNKSKEVIGFNPIQFIVPFTRVVANVTNRSLDWTPWGYVRALKGGMGSGKFRENKWSTKYTPEERHREIIKATAATIAMAALWALSDDENGSIEITADGTGDQKKNYELQETGWRPYSVRIGDKWYNYQNTPLSIPFAIIGFARDGMKYKGEKDMEAKASIALAGSAKYIMDMNFLSSLAGFFGAFSKDNPNEGQGFMSKISKEAGRTAKGFIVPNLFTQASKSLQEIYEIPMKRANGIVDEFVRDMPVLRDNLDNMYNSLGDPIIADQTRKFLPFKIKSDENEKVWDLIIENKAFIGSPSKNTIVYDPKAEIERELTDKEYNDYALKSGKLIKQTILEEYEELKLMTPGEIKDRIDEIKSESRKVVRSNLLN